MKKNIAKAKTDTKKKLNLTSKQTLRLISEAMYTNFGCQHIPTHPHGLSHLSEALYNYLRPQAHSWDFLHLSTAVNSFLKLSTPSHDPRYLSDALYNYLRPQAHSWDFLHLSTAVDSFLKLSTPSNDPRYLSEALYNYLRSSAHFWGFLHLSRFKPICITEMFFF